MRTDKQMTTATTEQKMNTTGKGAFTKHAATMFSSSQNNVSFTA